MRTFLYLAGIGALFITVGVAPVWADHPSVGFGEDSAGPVQTVSATPMPKGKLGASVSVEYQRFNRFSDAELRNFASVGRTVDSTDYLLSPALGLAYGLTEDVTLLARVPFPKRDNIRESELEDGEPEAHEHGDSFGAGDLVLLSKWRLLEVPVEVAPLIGLKVPTGETHEKDEAGKRFETDHQPGSGSWDGLFGLAVTKRSGSWTWSASGLYTLATEGTQDTDLGDHITVGLGAAYRINHHQPHSHAHDSAAPHAHRPLAADLILELLWEQRRPEVTSGRKNPESGETQLWIAPGIRLNFGRWGWATSVGVPVAQDFNGAQHEPEIKLLTVLSTGF